MPGIVGYVTTEAGFKPESFMKTMAQALEPDSGHYATELFQCESGGLGRVTPRNLTGASQPVWSDDRRFCLVLVGEIYDRDAVKAVLDSDSDHSATFSDAELFLRLFLQFGGEHASRVNGAFVVAVWDNVSRTLTVVNDRLGLFPLYYAHIGGMLLFASGVRALLVEPSLSRKTDALAIAQFLTFDHLLDDRTLLADVRLLPQASILTFSGGDLTIRTYWRMQYPDWYEPRPEAELRDELEGLLDQAVRRQIRSGEATGLLLSGGLDSRMLLAYLCRSIEPERLHTCTWGIPQCDDALIAYKLSRVAGTRHHFYELRPDYLLQTAQNAVRITDGLGNLVNLHALTIVEPILEHVKVLHKGFLGDAMFGFALQRPFWADYRSTDAQSVHMGVHRVQGVLNYTPAALSDLCTEAFNRDIGSSVFDSYRDAMYRSGSRQLGIQRLYFDLTQRVPRMTLNGVEAVRSRLDVRLPFADADLLDFALSVPPGYLFDRYIIRSTFTQTFPGFAKVPVADTGLPMISCVQDVLLRSRQIVRWHLVKSGLSWLTRPDRRPYKDYRSWFRTVLRPWLEETLLSSSALERGYFKPGAVRKLVSNHMEGSADHTIRLGALLTLETWHRQFLD